MATIATATETESVTQQDTQTTERRPAPRKPLTVAIRMMDQILEKTNSRTEYFRAVTHFMVDHFGGLYGSIDVRSGASHFSEDVQTPGLDIDTLLSLIDAIVLEAQSDDRSIARRFQSPGSKDTVAVSTPIHNGDGELAGALVVVLPSSDNESIKQAAVEIADLVSRIHVEKDREDEAAPRPLDQESLAMKAILRVANYSTPEEMAFSLVNSLAQKLDCTQVAMGRVEGNEIELLAVSGMSEFSTNSPGLVDVKQAMEECLDHRESILVQKSNEGGAAESDGYLLHRHWHQQTAASPVFSIPLKLDDETVNSVISLRRDANKPFLDADVEKAKSTLTPFGPAVELLARARQTTWQKIRQTVRETKRSIAQPKSKARRITSIATLVGLAIFLFGWMPFRLTVPCTIEVSQGRQITAPFDGMISEVLARPGDRVTKGQVLARFDTRDLMIERQAISAELNVAQVALNRAVMDGDAASAAVARAEYQLQSVRRAAIDQKIRMAEIRAADDGEVIRGDLITEIGAVKQMGTPLMRVAPKEGWFVQLKIPDSMSTYVKSGQIGQFASVSRPGDRQKVRVTRVVPSAEVVDGKNLFIAEADVEGDAEWMRAGMEGVAKIKTGWQPVWWIALHRITDPIRMGAS